MTAVQPTIHPAVSRTEKSLWEESVGPKTGNSKTEIETETMCWKGRGRFVQLNSGYNSFLFFFYFMRWLEFGFLTSLGHGTCLPSNLLVMMGAVPGSVLWGVDVGIRQHRLEQTRWTRNQIHLQPPSVRTIFGPSSSCKHSPKASHCGQKPWIFSNHLRVRPFLSHPVLCGLGPSCDRPRAPPHISPWRGAYSWGWRPSLWRVLDFVPWYLSVR